MHIAPRIAIGSLIGFCAVGLSTAHAEEPVTLANVVDPGPNRPDEPFAKRYSLPRALRFLDAAALSWQKRRDCMTCHTNYAYLLASSAVDSDRPALRQVRQYAEALVRERWETKGPRWPAEVVMTAAVLAGNDAATSGQLHPLSRRALDRMWTLQNEDGGWEWLKCDWPPMESDDFFGVTMALLAAGMAPNAYAATPAAQTGLRRIRQYLTANPVPNLHHEAMLVWASTYVDGILTPAQRKATVERLLAKQKPDGGWGLATLGEWKRMDEKPQDTRSSDGYGTGLVIHVARRAGFPATDPRLVRGIRWLETHQRESGRWFTRSLAKDGRHFLTHAGTAFAVLALRACDEERTHARASAVDQ